LVLVDEASQKSLQHGRPAREMILNITETERSFKRHFSQRKTIAAIPDQYLPGRFDNAFPGILHKNSLVDLTLLVN